jgi:TAT-translocated FGD2 family F420-dependent dehydrogenase
MAWVTLSAVGQRTNRIPFGTAVTCPTYRYKPAIVAEAFATLGLLNPGRVFLGVGTGEALNEVTAGGGWGPYQERADRIIEAIKVIRALWTGETINFKGKYYEVKYARLYDFPPTPVPIYIAAEGPKSARLAGEHGDGLITDSKSAVKPEIRQAFEAGARSAGKDPRTMPIIAEHFVCTGEQQEAERSADLWRFQPKAWTEYVRNPDPVSIMEDARKTVPLEQVVSSFIVSTNPDDHVQSIQKLIEGGVTTVLIHSAQEDQRSVIDFFGQRVLPNVQRQRSATAAGW